MLKPNGEFRDGLDKIIARMGWDKFSEITNRLKHADRDADAMIDPHPAHAMVGIGLAITLYHQITDSNTPEMRAFEIVMSVVAPDVFAGPPDPEAEAEAEGYNDLVKAVHRMQNATHEQLMEFGRGALYYFKNGEILESDPTKR